MKKTILTMALAAISAVGSYADDYGYLTFEALDGAQTSVAVDNLKITVVDGNLVVSNGTESATLSVASLSKMFFSSTSGVDNAILPEGSTEVKAYALSGVCVGTYRTVATAAAALPKGVYILKSGNETKKITVR